MGYPYLFKRDTEFVLDYLMDKTINLRDYSLSHRDIFPKVENVLKKGEGHVLYEVAIYRRTVNPDITMTSKKILSLFIHKNKNYFYVNTNTEYKQFLSITEAVKSLFKEKTFI